MSTMGAGCFMDWKGRPISRDKHGGTRAAFHIHSMVAVTNITYMPNVLDMVIYLRRTMHMSIAAAATTVTNFIGITCGFALLGGFLSDSYITRFYVILTFATLECLGFGLLSAQAHYPSLHPPPCMDNNITPHSNSSSSYTCKHVNGGQAALFYTGIYIFAMGEGGLRANLAPFGGDQFDEQADAKEARQKSSFFNWFGFSSSTGSLIGLVLVVWIENNKGWDYGFALSSAIILIGLLVVCSGVNVYRHQRPQGSPLTRILQVFVAACRKRKLALVDDTNELYQDQLKDIGETLSHTQGFKCLDKASILQGRNESNWSLCSVTQVEETKIVLRMLPIFISAVICYVPIPLLLTLTIQQGANMNTKLGSIHISTPNLLVIPVTFQMIILVLYDRLFVPFLGKFTGYKNGITSLQRIGFGLLSTTVAICIAAAVEMKRKSVASRHGLTEAGAHLPMSVFWLAGQFLACAVFEVFTFIGLLDFFNSEVSRGMKSLGTAIFWCIIGLASFMGTILVDVVNKITSHAGGGLERVGWLQGNNLNKNHLDWFYWLLASIEVVGFINYVFWARLYAYRRAPRIQIE